MQTGKRFRAYPTPPRNRSCSNGSDTSGSSIMPRYRKTGMTGPSPKKRSLFPEYPFPSIRSMHVSSARTPPGSGMSPPRSSETGRFAGNRRWDDPFPESPEDPSSRKKTDGNRAGSLPSSSLFDIKTKPTPRSLFSEQESSPWGIWSSRPIPHIPVPPPFTSWSRRGRGSSPSPRTTDSWLRMFSEEELRSKTLGFDRGVTIPLMASSGRRIDFAPIQKIRMEKKERAKKRWQRKLSRQVKGSNNRRKSRKRLARTFGYAKEVRKDVIHKATRDLVSEPDRNLFVVEDLKIKNMTRKPEGKQDDSGGYAKNGARAKAGLNRTILSSCWGLFVLFLSYKSLGSGKLVIKVSPQYSSQECVRCGHIHPDNRPSRAEFVCQRCGLKDNADHNASRVIARRGVRLLLEWKIQKKEIWRCGIGKGKQLGREPSEVKASFDSDQTRRPKRLRETSAKEDIRSRDRKHFRKPQNV